jgi:hypothetical protein
MPVDKYIEYTNHKGNLVLGEVSSKATHKFAKVYSHPESPLLVVREIIGDLGNTFIDVMYCDKENVAFLNNSPYYMHNKRLYPIKKTNKECIKILKEIL